MDKLTTAIVHELQARTAISPTQAQDAHAVRAAVGCSSVHFDAALVKLTDLEVVGAVMSDLYLRRDNPDVLRMLG
ncbi:MAG: hypothetical protein FJX25_02275 [Alphaproteobacteria bacterium]|nr:hypothetical protein [Alphaproteobacteria bacterium]